MDVGNNLFKNLSSLTDIQIQEERDIPDMGQEEPSNPARLAWGKEVKEWHSQWSGIYYLHFVD